MASVVVMPYDNHRDIPELLVISSSADINGSLFTDAIVQKNCSLHVWGSVSGSLTIEPGADVLIDGSVYGKIINRGSRLVVNHKGLTAFVVREGPSESEAGATLKINLTAIGFNWERLAKRTDVECAAVLSATPTAAASIRSRTRWPNRAAERSLSPILLKLDAFTQRRRIPSSMFFTGFTRAPRPSLQSLMRNRSLTAQSSWPSGTLSSARTGGRAAVR